MSLLKWFIDEQVEEENNFHSLLKKVRRSEGNPAALYMMDDELAARVFTPPTTTKQIKFRACINITFDKDYNQYEENIQMNFRI